MASRNSLISEEQLLCPICLEVFTRPVSTPCGHNFCMSCITTYWSDTPFHHCPVCKDTFFMVPPLKVNTFISELTSQFLLQQAGRRGPGGARSGAVLCDLCCDLQQEAARSCLQCLTSYCQLHLEPHRRAGGLQRHTLVEPLAGLEERLCHNHTRLVTHFCRNDRSLLCDVCAGSHLHHDVVSMKEAHKEMSVQLLTVQDRTQQMIQERLQKMGAVKKSVNGSMSEAKGLIRKSLQDLVMLVGEVQSCTSELLEEMESKQKVADEEVAEFFARVEAEISALREANGKLQELQQTKDPFRFLQNFQDKSALPSTNSTLDLVFSRLLEAEHAWKSMSNSVRLLQQLLHSSRTRLTLCSLYLRTASMSVSVMAKAQPLP